MRPINLVAALVIQNGKSYIRHETREGSLETGPYTLTSFCYRWGQIHVSLESNGFIDLRWPPSDEMGMGGWSPLALNEVGGLTIQGKLHELRKAYYLEQEDEAINALVKAVYPHG